MATVELQDVSKAYGAYRAVSGLTLTVASGECLALLGPSGCGKTTTLNMIAGFIEPDAGDVRVGGRPMAGVPPHRRDTGMVFQHYALFPHLTVFDNLAFGLVMRSTPRAEIVERVGAALTLVHLTGLERRYPRELSGGQQQRVALARALVIRPAVLLLDEPLSNLDANLREEMRYEIRRLHDEFRITTVYVTHDQAEAMVTSDRIAVMNQGRVEQVDAPRALYARPRTRFVAGFIGRTNFLEGEARDGLVAFDGFTTPAAQLGDGVPARGRLTFSLRPQSIHLHRQRPPAAEAAMVVPGAIVQRAYLGEHWDYLVRPAEGGLTLRVTARPHEVFEVSEKVWLEIDARQMAPIAPSGEQRPHRG